MRRDLARVLLFVLFCAVGEAAGQEQMKAPEIRGKIWVNAGRYKKVAMKELRGKVVLVFFWTSEDANCQTVAPLLNDWYARYQAQDFEIIGVHTPEWDFNSSESRLFKKIEALGIRFPVVVDADSSVRAAYGQQMWPSFCLIDRGGFIRAQYEGYFTYREIEKMLKALLEEGAPEALLRRSSRL